MLTIGHRGAAGLAPENTLEAMQAGFDMGADILEFDVKLTRDNVLLVVHDSTLLRTHKKATIIRWSTHESIKEATEKGHKIATLEEVFDMFFGKITLNLEIKSRGAGIAATKLIEQKYIKHASDWQNILFSSFKVRELSDVRNFSKKAKLSMLHDKNAFVYMVYHRRLHFSAVGFHRLRANPLAVAVARQLGLFVYVYTINRPSAARRFARKDFDAVVTDDPKMIREALKDIV